MTNLEILNNLLKGHHLNPSELNKAKSLLAQLEIEINLRK